MGVVTAYLLFKCEERSYERFGLIVSAFINTTMGREAALNTLQTDDRAMFTQLQS